MSRFDSVRVSVVVAVPPADAFDAFTTDVDAWWRRGPRFRVGGKTASTMRFEGGKGGRLVEICGDSADERYEFGKILEWDPPQHLRFELRAQVRVSEEVTWVDVRFELDPGGTRVTVENGGFEKFPVGHAVRHGADDAQFVSDMGRWWLDLLTTLRRVTTDGRPPR